MSKSIQPPHVTLSQAYLYQKSTRSTPLRPSIAVAVRDSAWPVAAFASSADSVGFPYCLVYFIFDTATYTLKIIAICDSQSTTLVKA